LKKLLLHTCCAPCGTSVFERLINEKEYAITSFYYNPNIKPREEWEKRLGELERLVGAHSVRPRCPTKQLIFVCKPTGAHCAPLHAGDCIFVRFANDLLILRHSGANTVWPYQEQKMSFFVGELCSPVAANQIYIRSRVTSLVLNDH